MRSTGYFRWAGLLSAIGVVLSQTPTVTASAPPNFILFFVDNLGNGDLKGTSKNLDCE